MGDVHAASAIEGTCIWGNCTNVPDQCLAGQCDATGDLFVGCWAEGTYRFEFSAGCYAFIGNTCTLDARICFEVTAFYGG